MKSFFASVALAGAASAKLFDKEANSQETPFLNLQEDQQTVTYPGIKLRLTSAAYSDNGYGTRVWLIDEDSNTSAYNMDWRLNKFETANN